MAREMKVKRKSIITKYLIVTVRWELNHFVVHAFFIVVENVC